MADDRTIRAIIKLLVEGGYIPAEVAKSIKGVGDQAKGTQKQLQGLTGASKDLASQLKQFIGLGALSAFATGAVREAAEVDRSFNAIARTLERLGIGGAQDIAGIRAQLEALAANGGSLVKDTAPAFQRFLGITHDINAAMAATTLASDAAKTSNIDYSTSVQGVVALLQGRARLAANLFGIALHETGDLTKDNAALMAQLQKQVSGASSAFDDAQTTISKTAAVWETLKVSVGEGLSETLGSLPDALFHVIGGFKDIGAAIGLLFNGIADSALGVGKILGSVFDLKTLVSDPAKYGKELNKAFSDSIDAIKGDWKIAWDQIAADHTKATQKIEGNEKGKNALIKQAALATAAAQAKIEQEARRKRFDEELATEKKILEAKIRASKDGSVERRELESKLLDLDEVEAVEHAKRTGADVEAVHRQFTDARTAEDRKVARDEADFQRAEQEKLIQTQAEFYKQGTDERFGLEMDLLNKQFIAEMHEAEIAGHDTAAIRLRYQQDVANKTLDFARAAAQRELQIEAASLAAKAELDQALLDLKLAGERDASESAFDVQRQLQDLQFAHDRQALEDEIAAKAVLVARGDVEAVQEKADLVAKLIALEVRHTTADKQLALAEKQYKEQVLISAARTGVQALETAFGKHKAFAIANIIIDTAAAIMQIWADPSSGTYWAKIVESAAVSALGTAQLARIRKTGVGAAHGAIVPRTAAEAATFTPEATDTVPAMLTPGEIVLPKSVSDDVLAGVAAVSGPGRGTPIIGGRVSVSPVKAWKGAVIGGASLSGSATRSLSAVLSAVPSRSDAEVVSGAIRSAISEVSVKMEGKAAQPMTVDQSITIAGNLYGGDAGMRQLAREIERHRRLDLNRRIA